MPFTTLLEEALEAWRYTRAGVVTEIENLSEADLRFKPNPESRTAGEIAVHIAESGMMMSGELSRPDGNFRRKSFPEFMKEYARGVKPARGGKRALVQMLKRTHTPEAPWYTVEADDKRRARLNCIAHILESIPYENVLPAPLELPARPPQADYERPARGQNTIVLDRY